MNPSMNSSFSRFKREVRHFHHLGILNIVFSALAIAYGTSYFVMAVLGQDAGIPSSEMRILTGLLAMVSFGLGLSWLTSTTRIFKGVAAISAELDSLSGTDTDERITCLIVRMLAHYRDNREIIRKMILVCTAGGCVIFLMGIINSLEILGITGTGGEVSFNAGRLIPPMLVSLCIAIAGILSSQYFSRVSATWDRRLHEIDESECILKQSLGLSES